MANVDVVRGVLQRFVQYENFLRIRNPYCMEQVGKSNLVEILGDETQGENWIRVAFRVVMETGNMPCNMGEKFGRKMTDHFRGKIAVGYEEKEVNVEEKDRIALIRIGMANDAYGR